MHGAIIDTGEEDDCVPLFDWLQVAITRNSEDNQPSPLAIPRPAAPLIDSYLILHCHNVLVHHFPGQEPYLQYNQGSPIVLHIRKVAVELCCDHEEKASIYVQANNRGFPKFLGNKLNYLLRLSQVS